MNGITQWRPFQPASLLRIMVHRWCCLSLKPTPSYWWVAFYVLIWPIVLFISVQQLGDVWHLSSFCQWEMSNKFPCANDLLKQIISFVKRSILVMGLGKLIFFAKSSHLHWFLAHWVTSRIPCGCPRPQVLLWWPAIRDVTEQCLLGRGDI